MSNGGENIDPAAPPATGSTDPDSWVSALALGLLLASLGLSALASSAGWWHTPFTPSQKSTANFSLFAGFFVATQGIERLLEIPSALIRLGSADHVRANRAQIMLGIATLAGVIVSFAFGLYFLRAIGMSTARWVDIFVSGLIIGAGTKPLHDLITTIQGAAASKA